MEMIAIQETLTAESQSAPTATRTATIEEPTQTATNLPPTETPTPTDLPPANLGPFQPVSLIEDLLPGLRVTLQAAPDGNILLVNEQGVGIYQVSDSTWEIIAQDPPGRIIGVDDLGRPWALSDGGDQIFAWEGGEWRGYGEDQGWQTILYRYTPCTITTDGSGHIWLTTYQDLRRFDGENWHSYTPEDIGMEPPEFEDLMLDFEVTFFEDSGQVWVSRCDWGGPGPFGGGGVRWFDGKSWHGTDSPVSTGCAYQVVGDNAGNIWMGVESTLHHYNTANGTWDQSPAPEEAPIGRRFGYFYEITLDPNGEPWAALIACGGAACDVGMAYYHVSDGIWEEVFVGEADYATHVFFDEAGRGWFYHFGMFYRIEDGELQPSEPIYTQFLTQDPSGSTWFIALYQDLVYLWKLQNE
jgi:hypothetical protein